MTKICRCGCKKTDHYDSLDWGNNKGDCKNCGWSVCTGFFEKLCLMKGCDNERESYFIYCQTHLDSEK